MDATRTARLEYVVLLTLPAALLALRASPALPAEAPGLIAELRQELRRPPEEAGPLREYEARLRACAKRVVRPGDLCAALMLEEWRASGGGRGVPPGRAEEAAVHLNVRKEMARRFREALRPSLRKGDRVRRLAALTLVGELADGEAARAAEEGPEEGDGTPGSTTAPLAPDLVALLGSEKDTEVRVAAVRALCKVRPEPKVLTRPLREALAAKVVSERRAAAEGLGRLLTAKPRESHAGAWVLEAEPRLVPLAGQGLKDEDAVVRRRCLEAIRQAARLLEQGIPRQPSLWGRSMGLPDPGEKGAEKAHRQFAAEAWKPLAPLARSLNRQIPAIQGSLKDADLAVCLAAHEALETIVTARHHLLQLAASLPPLREGGKEVVDFKDPLDQAPKAVPLLLGSLRHKEVRVRLASLYVLETLGADAAPAAGGLARSLSDKDPFVRWGAARALANMAPRGAKAVPALAKVLDDDSRDVRVTAAVALRRYGPSAAPAVGALAVVVRRGDAQMRVLAIRALEGVGRGAKPAVPALVKALSAEEPPVRAASARALGRLGAADRSARAALLKALDDPDADVRRAAGGALLGEP